VSAYSPKAAKISIWRAKSFFSSGVSVLQSLIASGFGAASCQADDAELDLAARTSSASRPILVELALVLGRSTPSHVGAARVVAPGAKYMKNGRSGVSDFWYCTQATALSVMSS